MGNITFTANEDGTTDAIGMQGATWGFTITLKDSVGTPIDLTNYNGRGQIRKNYTTTDITKSFTITKNVPATDGILNVSLSSANTAGIPRGRYVYDIEIYTAADADVKRILHGKLAVDPEVTK